MPAGFDVNAAYVRVRFVCGAALLDGCIQQEPAESLTSYRVLFLMLSNTTNEEMRIKASKLQTTASTPITLVGQANFTIKGGYGCDRSFRW